MLNQKTQNTVGYLMLLPILFFTALPVLFNCFKTLLYSFADYNILEPVKFNGLTNYIQILNDTTVTKSIISTCIFMLIVSVSLVILAVIPSLLIAKMSKIFGVLANIFYSAVFFIMICGFSTLINYFFAYSQNRNAWDSVLSVFLSVGICAFPTFAICYFFSRLRSRLFALCTTLCGIPLFISIFAHFQLKITGYPSVDQATDWLPLLIQDYATVRYEVGYAYALTVIGFGLFLAWCVLCIGITLLLKLFLRLLDKPLQNVTQSKVFKMISIICAILVIVTAAVLFAIMFFVTMLNALKPLGEIIIYPPKIMVLRPTLSNFSFAINLYQTIDFSPLKNTTSQIFWNYINLLFVALPSAIGFYLTKGKKLNILFLLPTLILIINQTLVILTTPYHLEISTVNSFIVYLLFFISNYLAIKAFAQKPKLRIIAVICGIASSFILPLSTALVTNSVYFRLGWNSVNSSYNSGGLARLGAACASNLMYVLYIAFVMFVPAILLISLIALNKTKKSN